VRSRKLPSALWAALNSSLVLWVLSALFLSGAPFVYTYWQQRRSDDRAAKVAIERLDLEIAYRYSQILTLCRNKQQMELRLFGHSGLLQMANATDGSHFVKFEHLSTIARRLEAIDELRDDVNRTRTGIANIPAVTPLLTSPPGSAYTALYPEYTNFSLLGLVNTLRDHVESQRDSNDLARVSAAMTKLPATSRLDAINFIKGRLILPRWRNRFWQYESCPPDDPLCNREYILNTNFAWTFFANNGEIIALDANHPVSTK
jgi:hypothetical protein